MNALMAGTLYLFLRGKLPVDQERVLHSRHILPMVGHGKETLAD